MNKFWYKKFVLRDVFVQEAYDSSILSCISQKLGPNKNKIV